MCSPATEDLDRGRRPGCGACPKRCSSAPRWNRPIRWASISKRDELAFFPFLYWPITRISRSPRRSLCQAEHLSAVRRHDPVRHARRRYRGLRHRQPEWPQAAAIGRPLDVPPLEPMPEDHVLTRTFYLLQDFPGRHNSRDVWVEAAPPDAEFVEGMPFRNLNDNVTPVVIGGNDWAAAWAMDDRGNPSIYPIGRGYSGRAPARNRVSLRGQSGHARADRELQIRPGARPCAAGQAGPMMTGRSSSTRSCPGRSSGRLGAVPLRRRVGSRYGADCGLGLRGWPRSWCWPRWRSRPTAGGSRAAVGHRDPGGRTKAPASSAGRARLVDVTEERREALITDWPHAKHRRCAASLSAMGRATPERSDVGAVERWQRNRADGSPGFSCERRAVHDLERAPGPARTDASSLTGKARPTGIAADRQERAGLRHPGRAGHADPAGRGRRRGARTGTRNR